MLEGLAERQLVVLSRDGDSSAYAELVRRYSARVYGICLGKLRNADDAEDVAQQVFLKGFLGIKRLKSSEAFGGWIGRIAGNQCTDFLRSRKRKERLTEDYAMESGGKDEGVDISEALEKLPEEYRVALMLYYFGGRSSKAIGEMLGVGTGAVQTRMSRARRMLREILEGWGKR